MSDLKFKEEIESLTGLSYPQSIEWVECQLDRGLGYGFYASFTLSRADIVLLFKDIEIEWSSTTRYVQDIKSVKWFRPSMIKKFKSFETYHPNNHSILRVIYDDSSGGKATGNVLFYIEWFELS